MHWKSPQSPTKQKARMSKSEFKAIIIVFSISGGLSTLIGCLKIRLSISFTIKMFWRQSMNVCDEGNQKCRIMPHVFFNTTTRQHTTRYLWRAIWRKTTIQWWNIHVLSGPSTVWLYFLPENQVCAQRNQVGVRVCSESKSDATLVQLNTRWPAALLPTVENSHGAV